MAPCILRVNIECLGSVERGFEQMRLARKSGEGSFGEEVTVNHVPDFKSGT